VPEVTEDAAVLRCAAVAFLDLVTDFFEVAFFVAVDRFAVLGFEVELCFAKTGIAVASIAMAHVTLSAKRRSPER